MDFNVKDGSNYLDGVPVKISSKFIPPRPVPLPFSFNENPALDFLDNLYDFTLEKSVIENHSKRLLQLEEAKLKSAENTPPETVNSNSSNEGLNQKEPQPGSHSNAQNVLSWQADSILQPKPQQPPDKMLSENAPLDSSYKINLSDFENDTSSPFDYMELQTINDLEELSSVFQGIHNSNPQEESPCVKNGTEAPVNVSKSKSFPLPISSKDLVGNVAGRDFGRGSFSASSYELPHTSFKQVEDYPGDSYLKLSQVPYISSNAGACVRPTPIQRVPSYLRASKSYSDISSLGKTDETPSERERSRTPPSTFSYSKDPEETSCKNVASSNGVCDNDLPDPYQELDSSAQEFVDSITEMGFSRPQVARTVKHLGTDEKKVVEHLCQIQALEESGYEGLEAEAALHLHDYNRDEAKMFLDLVSQFQDLGFEKKAVKKALVQNKNDWNKTIDALLL